MSLFNFNTIETWDVALHHGHSAFRLLKIVRDIETEYVANARMLKALPHGELQYLKIGAENEMFTGDMFKMASASIILFQAMMEAIINDSLEKEVMLSKVNKNGKFKEKWGNSLIETKRDTNTFHKYHNEIYTRFRIPLIHPKKTKLSQLNDISFQTLLDGFYNGWDAYDKLYEGLGHPHDPDSWNTMCQAHGLKGI